MRVAGGQKDWKGKILRIGHMGYIDRLDAITVIGALELSLSGLGAQFEKGEGVKAALTLL